MVLKLRPELCDIFIYNSFMYKDACFKHASLANKLENGLVSLALLIITLPAASAGAAFIAKVIIGLL